MKNVYLCVRICIFIYKRYRVYCGDIGGLQGSVVFRDYQFCLHFEQLPVCRNEFHAIVPKAWLLIKLRTIIWVYYRGFP